MVDAGQGPAVGVAPDDDGPALLPHPADELDAQSQGDPQAQRPAEAAAAGGEEEEEEEPVVGPIKKKTSCIEARRSRNEHVPCLAPARSLEGGQNCRAIPTIETCRRIILVRSARTRNRIGLDHSDLYSSPFRCVLTIRCRMTVDGMCPSWDISRIGPFRGAV
jgi:hypothetical protein